MTLTEVSQRLAVMRVTRLSLYVIRDKWTATIQGPYGMSGTSGHATAEEAVCRALMLL